MLARYRIWFWVAFCIAAGLLLNYSLQRAAELSARIEADALSHCTRMGGVVKMEYNPRREQFALTGCDIYPTGRVQ